MKKQKITTAPWCPFCGQKVGRASDAIKRKMDEFPVGRCQCGAVYTCDPTGHNIGAAMVETLVFACDDNWDLAWDLMPEDDYLTGRVEDYDEVTHQVVNTGNIDGRPVRGILYFVRLHTEAAAISKRVREKKDVVARGSVLPVAASGEISSAVAPEPKLDPNRVKVKATKKIVTEAREKGDIDTLVALCFDNKKTLRFMQRLLYDVDEAHRWETAWIIGQVCSRVASKAPGQVSELMHRLFEACSDSAATPWGMVETLGEIIAGRPDIFGAFTRHLLNYMGDASTQVQVVWALSKIAEKRPDLIRETTFFNLFHFLKHPDPAMRGLVVQLLGRIRATEVTMQLMELSDDDATLKIWEEGTSQEYKVSDLVKVALEQIRPSV
ncbi:MAG: HEAT repeat domain-containing protein [Proteobacteria bacterium]|nr:HEAT repeat domain-containing protein [Pseudomonadota bacterium]MBU1234968.1 HEAT repeat domain-containing protein [Pseudomonadota bacterium]MBU1417589.1 HEAT repeat domain-containing protein [Pseudomonadota bacterium]MBU1454740.1 HEAT repeat domain-containing protein [Pseudomonadota bacterium]